MNANAQPTVRRPVPVKAFRLFADQSGVISRVNYRREQIVPKPVHAPAPRPR